MDDSYGRLRCTGKGDALWAEAGASIWVSAEADQQSPHDLPRD